MSPKQSDFKILRRGAPRLRMTSSEVILSDPKGRQKARAKNLHQIASSCDDSRTKAFTLIELTIVLTLIGIIAAIAIPRYLNLVNEAKFNTTKGILGNVRSAITIVHAKEILQGRDTFPTLEQIQDNPFNTGSSIMEGGDLPANPFSTGPDKDSVVLAVGRPNPTGTDGAWAYDAITGSFFANTKSGNGEELL